MVKVCTTTCFVLPSPIYFGSAMESAAQCVQGISLGIEILDDCYLETLKNALIVVFLVDVSSSLVGTWAHRQSPPS